MKRSDIIKKLRAEADEFAPDPIEKIKAKADIGAQRAGTDRSGAEKRRRGGGYRVRRRGLIASIAAAAAVIAVVVTAVVAGRGVTPGGTGGNSVRLSAQDAYGIGAVSSVKLLGTGVSAAAMSAFAELGNEAVTVTAEEVGDTDERKAATEKFNEYFRALDGFGGDDVVKTTVGDNDDESYPYAKKMTIEGVGMDGRKVVYVMYYDETEVKTEEDDGEIEKEYSLNGVITIDGKEYAVEGMRSEESEDDERESELRIRAYADATDKTTYVEMERENSVEEGETETEYVYSIYRGGVLIEQTAVEFERENENGKEEIAYEIEFRRGETIGKYEVEREAGNEVKVKYATGGKTGSFVIREVSGADGKKFEYEFENGEKFYFDAE